MTLLQNINKILFILCISLPIAGNSQQPSNPEKEEILDAMKLASQFMAEKVSCNGGYLWKYAEDFSEVQGEVPARPTQIMVQSGTPDMGHLFLDLYECCQDEIYLEYAKKAADALIYGQLPAGGWHYFIDFDMKGLSSWYKNVSSKFITGYEEYRHYYGNCTFDDNTTQSATTYLLRLYMATLSPEYLFPLKKALNFILEAQYPNGGWPQRYPLHYEYTSEGHPDYTSLYTLNDNAMTNTINLLLEAYRQLGDERYLEAARRGGDFFIVSQGPTGQAAWAEQYDMNLQPTWGRTHEPPSFMVRQTVNTLGTLARLFLFTGDKRYLRPFPGTLDWLNESELRKSENGMSEFARVYEPGSNNPIAVDVLDSCNREGCQLYNFYPVDKNTYLKKREESAGNSHAVIKQTQGIPFFYNLNEINDRYNILFNAKKEELPILYNKYFQTEKKEIKTDKKEIHNLIKNMNTEGAWVEDIQIWNYKPGQRIEGKKTIKGYSVESYIENMRKMMNYINTL